MLNKKLIIVFLVLTFVVIIFAEQPIKNTQVTVYNNNLGLIRQIRTLDLKKGMSEIRIEGVSAKIDPTSVHLIFPKQAKKVEILEQNFLYDLVSSHKIFEKYTGETITYRLENGNEITGQLLNVDGSKLILKLPEGGIRIASTKTILDYEFPSLPEGLILKPTLQWLLDSKYKGNTDAELSYLTEGMSWHAEYVMILEENERDFSLSSWVSLDNNSGATYENAKLKLVAGTIHRAPVRRRALMERETRAAPLLAKGRGFKERELFDYHLYDLQRPVTIKDREIKQVALFDEVSASAEKFYIFSNFANSESEKPLIVHLKINNSKSNNLGFPLPEGVVRIFKKDIDKTLQLIGEDRISHTSKDDTLHLEIGNAFDVKGKRVIKERTKVSKRSEKVSVEIKIFNRKNKNIKVELHESHSGDWFVKNASHNYIKKSNSLLVFPIEVKANQTITVNYTFQKKW